MSEPTKEREHVLMADLAGSRQRIRDQDEKIASLERQLAEAKSLIEAHRKAWQAALAPAAQTQQGLSEEEILTALEGIDASFVGGFVRCERCGDQETTDDLDMRRDIQDLIAKIKAGRPSPEKQPSPAAAPARLSEALMKALRAARSALADEHYVLDNGAHGIGAEQGWDETDCPFCSTDPAALAGQPAPTDDQKALRAAAMEGPHDPVKVARILELAAATDCGNHWNSDGDPCADETCLHCRAGEMLPELRCRCGKFSLDRSTPSLWEGGATPAPINHAHDECATPAPAKHCPTCAQTVPDGRALAGSPAQRGQLTKEGAK